MNKKNMSTSWGKVAGWYDNLLESNDTYQAQVIKPNLLRLLNVQKGEWCLDVGCGQGYFSREIARCGARVTGVDVAADLVAIARQKSGPDETYVVESAEHMASAESGRYDAAICVLALQNMKHLQNAVAEMARALKTGGRAVFVLNHPAFRVPTASEWGYDEKKNSQFRRVDRYMSEISQAVDMTQGIRNPRKKIHTYSFHHPLQTYCKAFYKCGLAITRLEEWVSHKVSDKGSRKKAEDQARKEIPLFMAIEVKKLA